MAFELTASDPQVVFAAVAALIFLGFLGNLVFSRLRFNDTLILIAVGVVLGPVLRAVDTEAVQQISAVVGPLALILILFDGGLALKLTDLVKGLGSAALLGFVGFTLTMFAIGGVVAWSLEFPFLIGLVLGAILAGTSALVVLPSLQHMKCQKKTATTLGLESALTDVLVVVVSFTLINIAAARYLPEVAGNGAIDAQGIVSPLVIIFTMSLVVGAVAGFLWLFLLPQLREKPFGYMLTLGVMFALYVIVEWLLADNGSGGGPLAVLAFGIVLGNHERFGTIGKRVGDDFGTGMKRFQGEIAFLVRTFFFVYLGILVDLAIFTEPRIWVAGILVFAAMLLARYAAVVATTRSPRLEGDAGILWVMGPRGLAAAVLAAIPASRGIPHTGDFVAIAFLILVFSNLMATIGAMVLGGDDKASSKRAPALSAKRATPSGAGRKKAARK